MDFYVTWVKSNPLLSAFIQFAVLGTIGEIISLSLKNKKLTIGGTIPQLAAKIFAWGILGVFIKYGFVAMKGTVKALIFHQLFPGFFEKGFFWAFAVSVVTNVFFGPQMMYFHRLEENVIHRKCDFSGLDFALKTLIWFWIPAHTVTFMLPSEFQIGLAALWSIALGIILGLALPQK
ncbi:MAG: hypothetical protein Kow00108_24490 [Calditrichia bacterium]